MTDTIPEPPSHLAGSRALFEQIACEWTLAPEEVQILTLACESVDRASSARRAIRRHGQTYNAEPHGSPRPRPELAIARSEAQLAARLLKQLDLGDDEELQRATPRAVTRSGRLSRAKASR